MEAINSKSINEASLASARFKIKKLSKGLMTLILELVKAVVIQYPMGG